MDLRLTTANENGPCGKYERTWQRAPAAAFPKTKGSHRNKFTFLREGRAATQAMPDIVEERQQRRYAPFAARAPAGLQQNANLFLCKP